MKIIAYARQDGVVLIVELVSNIGIVQVLELASIQMNVFVTQNSAFFALITHLLALFKLKMSFWIKQ